MKSNRLMLVVVGVFLLCMFVYGVTAAPVAAFSGTPTSGTAPLAVGFTESGE